MSLGYLRPRNWSKVMDQFFLSQNLRFTVVDDVLTEEAARQLRCVLRAHWGWRRKDWLSQHLHNSLKGCPEASAPFREIADAATALSADTDAVSALLYTANTPGKLHYDGFGVAATLWLTEDKYNLSPGTGGLRLFATAVDPEDPDYTSSDSFINIINRKFGSQLPILEEIDYKYNRMILFDANIIHETCPINFSHSDVRGHRLNLSYVFGLNGMVE